MLVIVNSMPKCGSTWFHNYVGACLAALGHPSAQNALASWPIRLNHRDNPGALSGENLRILGEASRAETFAIKAHQPPGPELLSAIRDGWVRTVFLIRHPTAIVRSALAYGEFCRAHEWDEPYRELVTAAQAAEFVAPTVEWGVGWLAAGSPVLRYEVLFAGDAEVRAAAHSLVPEAASVSGRILDDMRPEALSPENRDWLRVNLTHRPELPPGVEARCDAWARHLGY
jgi:hypothetical protein